MDYNSQTSSPEKKMVKLRNPEYPEGSQLFDVRYYTSPSECFEVIIYNPLTKKLEVYYEEPFIDIWFVKEEYREEYISRYDNQPIQSAQIPMEHLYPVKCKPSQICKIIAETMKEDKWCSEYYEYYEQNRGYLKNNALKKHMCECPWVLKADFTEDVYYRIKWLQKHGRQSDISNVTYALLDIEIDIVDNTINMRDIHDVSQPVNAATLILPAEKICAVFVLGPRPKGKLSPKFHNLLEKQEKDYLWLISHQEEFKRMIIEDDKDNKQYLEGYEIRLHIFEYEYEINLIKTIFDYINKYRPWFCMSWNAKFDHNYLMNRITRLGYSPYDIIIPKEFKTSKLYYHEDMNAEADFSNSKDWWFTSTYTQYVCQQRQYAAIRKSQTKPRSLSLNYTGKEVAGIVKLSEKREGTFREWAYLDFITFLLYNVRDVVVQLAIETKVGDCRSVYSRSYMFATQYSKLFQETHIVRNEREVFYEEKGFIQSNRLLIPPNIDSHYKGAFVAPTEKNAPTGNLLNGKRINNVIYGASDADAASYYPSSKMGTNQDPMTLLYKMKIDNEVFISRACNNRSLNQTYYWTDSDGDSHAEDIGGYLVNAWKNGNLMSLLYNYFNLPSITECHKYLDMNL